MEQVVAALIIVVGVMAVEKAEEVRLGLMVARDVVRAALASTTGEWWPEFRIMSGPRQGPSTRRHLIVFLQLVVELLHAPRWRFCVAQSEASDYFLGGCCYLRCKAQ